MKTFLLGALCFLVLTEVSEAGEHPESDYVSVPISEVLTVYGRMTGTNVLRDNTVQGEILLPKLQDLSEEKKIELIEKSIFLNGFTLLDAGDHVVAVLGLGKQPRIEGLPVYTKPEELPSGERVFSYVFKLEHRNAQHLAALLQQYLPPVNSMAFTADTEARILLVTARTSEVRRLLKLVPLLDVPEAAADKAPEKPPQPTSRPAPAA